MQYKLTSLAWKRSINPNGNLTVFSLSCSCLFSNFPDSTIDLFYSLLKN